MYKVEYKVSDDYDLMHDNFVKNFNDIDQGKYIHLILNE